MAPIKGRTTVGAATWAAEHVPVSLPPCAAGGLGLVGMQPLDPDACHVGVTLPEGPGRRCGSMQSGTEVEISPS